MSESERERFISEKLRLEEPEEYLRKRGIELELVEKNFSSQYLGLALKFIPEEYLDSNYLKKIIIGSYGGTYFSSRDLGAVTEEGKLYIFDTIVQEPGLMNFFRTFFHEMGHIIERKLKDEGNKRRIYGGEIINVRRSSGRIENDWVLKGYDAKTGEALVFKRDKRGRILRKRITQEELYKLNPLTNKHQVLVEAYGVISQANAFRAGEFGRFTRSRIKLQRISFSEFFAEFNKMFILEGEDLRKFISQQSGQVKKAYQKVYSLFKEIHGKEYFNQDVQPLLEISQRRREEIVDQHGNELFKVFQREGKLEDWERKYFRKISGGLEFEDWARAKGLIEKE